MASSIRVNVHGLSELRRDLDGVAMGLSREVTVALRAAGEVVLPSAKAFTPTGPGPHAANPGDLLPHIKDTLAVQASATTARIVSDHPGVLVHEFGGTIAPAGHPITIAESAMAGKAGQKHIGDIERVLAERVDRLASRHDL